MDTYQNQTLDIHMNQIIGTQKCQMTDENQSQIKNENKELDDLKETIVRRETVHEGKIVRFEKLVVEMPNGVNADRDIIRHPGGCVIIPVDEENNLYLVKQYRVAFESVTLELPAGKLDKGEEPIVCATRELEEETGLQAQEIRAVISVYLSPGFCDEVLHVFMATGLKQGVARPDDDEFVKIEKYSIAELMTMIQTGEIKDAKTVIGVMIAERRLRNDAEGQIDL